MKSQGPILSILSIHVKYVVHFTTIVAVLLATPFCVITTGTADPGVTFVGTVTFT
jgi:hypothetical protein